MLLSIAALISASILSIGADTPPTNLPDVPEGLFNVSAQTIINAPLSVVREVLLDFPSYPEWNPFVRSQVITNSRWIPIDDQTPYENSRVIIKVQIPPLEPPITSSTPSNPLHAQTAYDNITNIDMDGNRFSWISMVPPKASLDAQRWTALSEVDGGGGTFYESREVFRGPLASIVLKLYAEGIQAGYDAQTAALKERVEGLVLREKLRIQGN